MPESVFEREVDIEAPVTELRDWHFRPGAFSRLTPPWEPAELLKGFDELKDGARATIELKTGPFRPHWIAEHEVTANGFVDRQIKGPFASWEHEHRFEAIDERRCRLTDSIHYRLPFGLPGEWAGGAIVRRKLSRMFRYRHEVTRLDLERRDAAIPLQSHTILMTGATGMIGKALTGYLETQGHRVIPITRHPKSNREIHWDPENGKLELPDSLTFDSVIHLAGENVADGRWSEEKRRRIRESRREGTRLLAETLIRRERKPDVVISASGSGFYELGTGPHDEESPCGSHFLARVCEEWERAASPLEKAGIRTVRARIGVVLSPCGGALRRLLPIFQNGLGGAVGNGQQRLSWIALDDLIDCLHRFVVDPSWSGPVNLVSPDPITNRKFSRTLARVLGRPSFFPTPAFAIEAAFGEMARETILADVAVIPGQLLAREYPFRYPDLQSALSHSIGRTISGT
ncbi:MAG: TIGR01777 family oxidoreductase [Verrucomicrobiota bacterium]